MATRAGLVESVDEEGRGTGRHAGRRGGVVEVGAVDATGAESSAARASAAV